MKLIRNCFLAGFTYLLLFYGSSNIASCGKEIIHDTVIVIEKDTVTIIDSSACYDLTQGLVAYYNFNGGTLKDSSGNGNHISFNNATATTDRKGRANNAYLFNGTSNYMTAPNSASLNPTSAITLSALFKANGFYAGECHNNQIFGKGWNDFVNGHYGLRFAYTDGPCSGGQDTNKVYFGGGYGDLTNRAGARDLSAGVHTGRWYHAVFTYANGVSRFYVDGVLKSEVPQNPGPTFSPNTQELFIGKHGDPQFPYWFNGIIDELRIYNRALCEAEVKLLHKSDK